MSERTWFLTTLLRIQSVLAFLMGFSRAKSRSYLRQLNNSFTPLLRTTRDPVTPEPKPAPEPLSSLEGLIAHYEQEAAIA